jgi:hypothetical protein
MISLQRLSSLSGTPPASTERWPVITTPANCERGAAWRGEVLRHFSSALS